MRSIRLAARSALALGLCGALIAGHASPLAAQELTSEERATGEKLYERGVALMQQERYDEACPLLEQGVTVVRRQGIGGLLALAECREKQGKTATAWGLYREVASKARMAGQQDRLKMAEQGVSRLEATLHQIEIRGGAELAAIEGIVVEVQGRTVASSLLAASIPVDPGPWKIDVRAPDGRVGSATVSVPDAAGTTPLTLELRPIDQPAPSSDGVSGLTIAGIIVTSVGATAMLTGGIVFGVASGAYPSQCEGAAGEFDPVECPETALRDEANDARGLGDVGGIVFWSGLGVAATGVVLLLIPALADDSSSAARVVPWVGPTQAGASVTVAF